MNVLVLNGPNLNLLGGREPDLYGTATLKEIEEETRGLATRLGIEVEFRQTNHEGVLLDWLQEAPERFQGVILNPGAFTHTSIALMDALLALPIRVVEVHLSNLARREEFRQNSFVARAVVGRIEGFGGLSYRLALQALFELSGQPQHKG